MPTFQYQTLASKSDGAVIDAPDRAAALRELRRQGITAVKVEQLSGIAARRRAREVENSVDAAPGAIGEAAGHSVRTVRRGRGMSRGDMATFVRELATAVQAGLPLVQALRTIARAMHAPGHKAVVERMIHSVEHGKSLAEAAEEIGRPFSELLISLIRAGEASGRLGEILDQAANLLDRDLKLRRTLISGLIYPAILLVLIVVAIGVIVGFIVPKIIAPFAGKLDPSKLPMPTRIVTAAGQFVGSYWWAIAAFGVLSYLTVVAMYRQPASRLSMDRFLLRVPMLGKVLRDIAVARFTRTLGTLVSSGLPALSALRITRATLGNKAMEQVVEEVCEQVASGKTISDPMERSGYFPGLLTQIIGLGERSGRLPQMLLQAANVFEERTESSLKVFTATFPPLMVMVAAAVIGFVMAAVLLPLIQLQDLIPT